MSLISRSESVEGLRRRLTSEPIRSDSPGSPMGGQYRFVDEEVVPGTTYYDWLDALQNASPTTTYGPKLVQLGASDPALGQRFNTQLPKCFALYQRLSGLQYHPTGLDNCGLVCAAKH